MNFKYQKINENDISILKEFTQNFLPYSEFVPSNIFNWNKKNNETKYLIIDDVLILEARDNLGMKIVHSFLGKKIPKILLQNLLNNYGSLNYIPKDVVDSNISVFKELGLKIQEDRDNFDYIYDVTTLVEIKGHTFENRRRWISKFERTYPEFSFNTIDLSSKTNRQDMQILYDFWLNNWLVKSENHRDFITSENDAFKRFIENSNLFNYKVFGIYIDSRLVAFSVYDLLNNSDFAVGIFAKADVSVKGIYSYLNYRCAKSLGDIGVCKLNHEMDLGFAGLRNSKLSWGNCEFFKKYYVTS